MLQISFAVVCPADWVLLGGRCYLFEQSRRYNQTAAEKQCLHYGAHLVVQETQEELEILVAHLNNTYTDPTHQFWIGLRSRPTDSFARKYITLTFRIVTKINCCSPQCNTLRGVTSMVKVSDCYTPFSTSSGIPFG